MMELTKRLIVVQFLEQKGDKIEEETDNCTSLAKEQKVSKHLSEQKTDRMEGSLIEKN